ncbi:ribonuclease HII [Jatrophihabitans telluris]|uniref:Ribonuclease HII n=1 Tax=Jatrophihabitans telluris TaxID=2038343 RepID=A0ABY4R4M2_9ACTN|nr:ribonuclease HII [Jatrophihabitans telluris]UQX90006.1 ribonuclease HII [Jatrophihabitans telluris]
MTPPPPTLRLEREAWRCGAGLLAAIDEVGRGALAGPVSVGVVLLSAETKPAPYGVADSKLLTPAARQALVPRIRRWALDCAVGHASAAEIDQIGIIAALRLAAERAVSQLAHRPDWVLLDGNHDYLSARDELALFDPRPDIGEPGRWRCRVPVRTLIKGDMKCSSIAAASVLAKTERDGMLVTLAEQYPHYGFDENKAYASPRHLAALSEHGPSEIHRRSWNLPGALRAATAVSDNDQMLMDEIADAVGLDGDPLSERELAELARRVGPDQAVGA